MTRQLHEAHSLSPHQVREPLIARPPIEVVIPQDVAVNLREGAERFTETLEKFQPDLVLVPLRAGALVYPALASFAAAKKARIPPVDYAYIGRATRVRFENYLRATDTSMEDVAELYLAEHLDAFRKWLATDKMVGREVKKMKAKVNNMTPRKVLVVDDFRKVGETLDIVIPEVVRLAFGQNVTIDNLVMFDKDGWDERILEATFGERSDAQVYFLAEAVSGWIQTEDNDIVRIRKRTHLEELGRYTAQKYKGEDPYAVLSQEFGDANLISLQARLVNKLKETVAI